MISDNFYKVGEITNLLRKSQKQSNNNYSNFFNMKEGYPQHSRTESKTQNAREIFIRIDSLTNYPLVI